MRFLTNGRQPLSRGPNSPLPSGPSQSPRYLRAWLSLALREIDSAC
jgi:hypothetical protein